MVMRFQTWDNGKYGRIWRVDDDDYSWKYTDWNNGLIRDEDWDNSPVIASHFIGYCINNEPKGDGDIYTPFFTYYYKVCLEKYRKKHIDDIELIRDQKKLEKWFWTIHVREECVAYEASKLLFEFDTSKASYYTKLFDGYMNYLKEKRPLYFVFREKKIPEVFSSLIFDYIAEKGFSYTEEGLDKVLDLSLGRIFAADIINGGYAPTAEDVEQVKAVYGDSVNPDEVYYIRFNSASKKKIAQAVCDWFRKYMGENRFVSVTEKDLILEHTIQWNKDIQENVEERSNVEIIRHQLELCLRRIDDANKDEHKPFMDLSYMPLDDDNVVAGLDCYGYAAVPYHRLDDDDFKNLMDAFDRWAKQGNNFLLEETPKAESNEQQVEEKTAKETVSTSTIQEKNKGKVKKKHSKKNVYPKIINEKVFREHFTMTFRNLGYFDYLVSDIQELHTKKECQIVAKMIYDSKQGFINSFSTFASWSRLFFKSIGVEVTKKYNYSKTYKVPKSLEKKFNYL